MVGRGLHRSKINEKWGTLLLLFPYPIYYERWAERDKGLKKL